MPLHCITGNPGGPILHTFKPLGVDEVLIKEISPEAELLEQ